MDMIMMIMMMAHSRCELTHRPKSCLLFPPPIPYGPDNGERLNFAEYVDSTVDHILVSDRRGDQSRII